MTDVRIDRLTLEVPGISEEDGGRLAARVATRLAAMDFPVAVAPRGAFRVHLSAGADRGVDALSERIVLAIARQIARAG